MTPKYLPLVKRILYPAVLLAVHSIVENWSAIVTTLGPHYAWLAGPTVVAIGAAILHQLESPGSSNAQIP